jgi:hypothetical protein
VWKRLFTVTLLLGTLGWGCNSCVAVSLNNDNFNGAYGSVWLNTEFGNDTSMVSSNLIIINDTGFQMGYYKEKSGQNNMGDDYFWSEFPETLTWIMDEHKQQRLCKHLCVKGGYEKMGDTTLLHILLKDKNNVVQDYALRALKISHNNNSNSGHIFTIHPTIQRYPHDKKYMQMTISDYRQDGQRPLHGFTRQIHELKYEEYPSQCIIDDLVGIVGGNLYLYLSRVQGDFWFKQHSGYKWYNYDLSKYFSEYS